MLTIAYYLLKVIICSGILYGYYLLALRNKAFHRWNRFYLLLSVCLSILLPLIKIDVTQNINTESPQVFQILQVVNSGDEFVESYSTSRGPVNLDYSFLIIGIYAFISLLILTLLIRTIIKIQTLKLRYQAISVEGINFINTTAEGTPFSFFRNIFWNQQIDINSAIGKNIFQHEVAHVRELHSHDKMFINAVLVFLWCNPFFWLIRKELNMIHEFIADKIAMEDGDTAAFANMILQATYPQQRFILTNNFFYSPIKRRLTMLSKNKNPHLGYIGRLLVLPVAAVIFLAFTLKMKTSLAGRLYEGKKFIVIIDVAHGGKDNGASFNGINEKDLTLSISKKIKALNANKDIDIILTRERDEAIPLEERINMVAINKADIYIGVHIDAAMNPKSGLSVLISKRIDNAYSAKSTILGNTLIDAFNNNYQLPIKKALYQRDKGIMVLDRNQCPAVIIEAGYINNPDDLNFLLKDESQNVIAQNILKAIENYAMLASSNISQKIEIPAQAENSRLQPIKPESRDSVPESPVKSGKNFLVIKDGIELGYGEKVVAEINPQDILKINVLKGEAAIKIYGNRAKDGVIEIITKPAKIRDSTIKNEIAPELSIKEQQPTDSMIFTRVEHPAEFESGDKDWQSYLQNIFQINPGILDAPESRGVCMLKFIVDKNGKVRDVEALTMKNSKLSEIMITAISASKWKPGVQNGHVVTSYKTISITNK